MFVNLFSYTGASASANENENENANDGNSNGDGDKNGVKDLHDLVPAPLNLNNFDEHLKKGYHIVEFFSPYCPHCTNLFPTWVKFYLNNEEREDLKNYEIHQVDCVASGDLCDREGIRYYPVVRFYGPNSKLLGSMVENPKNLQTLNSFVDDQLIIWSENNLQVLSDNESTSDNSLIDESNLLNIISGNIDKPHIISFWPTSNNQLNDGNFQNDFKDNIIFTSFEYLYSFRNLWNLVINRITQINNDPIQFNYFNCNTNTKSNQICKTLGFENLNGINENTLNYPKIILYLPKDSGNSIYFNFNLNPLKNFNLSIKLVSKWIEKNLINSQLKDLPFNDIRSFLDAKTSLNSKGEISEFTDYSKIAFVLVNDAKTKVYEDDILLEHLLQSVADLPSDVYLFKTDDNEKVMNFLKEQELNLSNKYSHIGASDPDSDYKFTDEMFYSRTHTSFPMLLCIKSGSIYSPIFTSFMTKDIRDFNKVSNFIKMNSLPIVNHLNSNNYKLIFPPDFFKTLNDKSEKVLITLTDFQPKHFFDVEFYLSYIYHKQMLDLEVKKFNKIEQEREKKYENVEKVSDNTDDKIDALRKPIDHNYNLPNNKIYPVYLNIDDFEEVRRKMNWNNLNLENFKPGDSIIVERFGNSYWDLDESNEKLTIDEPDKTFDFLMKLNYKSSKGSKKLHTKPLILQIIGYAILVYVILHSFKMSKKLIQNRKMKQDRMKGLGILGLDKVPLSSINSNGNLDSKFD